MKASFFKDWTQVQPGHKVKMHHQHWLTGTHNTHKYPQQDTVKIVQSLTCEVFQTQLTQAKISITSVVEEDCKGVPVLVQLGSSDDPQVLQRQVVELVQGHQHIACHFSDWLWIELWREVLVCVVTVHNIVASIKTHRSKSLRGRTWKGKWKPTSLGESKITDSVNKLVQG